MESSLFAYIRQPRVSTLIKTPHQKQADSEYTPSE